MRIVENLSQNTPMWTEYRRRHIGSSDSGSIMGLNPYRSALSVWEEKALGWEQEFDQKSLDRMSAGTAMEPVARQAYEKLVGYLVCPMVIEHDSFEFLSASMDGMSVNLSKAVEIKCGAYSHKYAQSGGINDCYICQMQHQMLVTGLHSIDYFSYYKGEGILLTVIRDEELIKEMLEKEIEFWHHVQSGTPPED